LFVASNSTEVCEGIESNVSAFRFPQVLCNL
jgi:hypothetical protein